MRRVLGIVGGGSCYVPVLLSALIRSGMEFPFCHIKLLDPNGRQVAIIRDWARMELSRHGIDCQVDIGEDSSEMLADCDFVVNLFRVGGQHARHVDALAARSVGLVSQETQGWGGFSSAMRNVPVAHEIAQRMEELCPTAWLINITNPVGIITQACERVFPGRTIGICDIPYKMQSAVKAVLTHADNCVMTYLGLNHLSWITSVSVGDRNSMSNVLEPALASLYGRFDLTEPDRNWLLSLCRTTNLVPSPYLYYYYFAQHAIQRERERSVTRAEECARIDEETLRRLQNKHDSWAESAGRRGGFGLGDVFVKTIAFLEGQPSESIFANLATGNTMFAMAPGQVVERVVSRDDLKVRAPDLIEHVTPEGERHICGLVTPLVLFQEAVIDASLHRTFSEAVYAASLHPLIASASMTAIHDLVGDLLESLDYPQ